MTKYIGLSPQSGAAKAIRPYFKLFLFFAKPFQEKLGGDETRHDPWNMFVALIGSIILFLASDPISATAEKLPALIDGFDSDYVLTSYERYDRGIIGRYQSYPLANSPIHALLLIDGAITPAASHILSSSIAKTQANSYLYLRSDGGFVAEATALGRQVRALEFTTYVEAGQSCLSACLLLFLGGKHRIASRQAIIGFHKPYYLSAPLNSSIDKAGTLSVEDQREDCSYITTMLGQDVAQNETCSTLFTKNMTVYSNVWLRAQNITTESEEQWEVELASHLAPSKFSGIETQYYLCELAKKFLSHSNEKKEPAHRQSRRATKSRSQPAQPDCNIAVAEQCDIPNPPRHRLIAALSNISVSPSCPLH